MTEAEQRVLGVERHVRARGEHGRHRARHVERQPVRVRARRRSARRAARPALAPQFADDRGGGVHDRRQDRGPVERRRRRRSALRGELADVRDDAPRGSPASRRGRSSRRPSARSSNGRLQPHEIASPPPPGSPRACRNLRHDLGGRCPRRRALAPRRGSSGSTPSPFVSTVTDARCAATRPRRGTRRLADDRVRRRRRRRTGRLEQPEQELLPQQPARRHVQPLLGHLAVAHELDEQVGACLAAELVGAGVQDLLHPLASGSGARHPRRGPGTAARRCRRVVDQPPVGADDAVEAEALAQQAGEHRLVEAEADLLVPRCRRACRSTA